MIAYILKVTLCWLFFYGVYELFLKKKTFFKANRTYLLVTLAAGIILPLLEFVPWKNESNVAYVIYPMLMEIDDLQAIVTSRKADAFNWMSVLYFIYAVGFIVSFVRFSMGIKRILELYWSSEKIANKAYTLVMTDRAHLPFSFFKWVFFSRKVTMDKEVNEILHHEIEHIKGRHSIDVLVTEFLKVVFWCSPMIYLYRNALKEVHEYLADQVVLKNTDKKTYKKLLLSQTNSSLQMALTHQFFNSHLKNRLKMINQKRSGRPTLVMYALGIPVLLLLLFAFTFSFQPDNQANFEKSLDKESLEKLISEGGQWNEELAHEIFNKIANERDTVPKENHVANKDYNGEIFKVVEQMPRFPGCEDVIGTDKEKEDCAKQKMLEYIYMNLKYPKVARDAGIEGMNVVQFVITNEGRIKDARIVRSVSPELDEQTLSVVESMDEMDVAWTPGFQRGNAVNVMYTLPVRFKLQGDKKVEVEKLNVDTTVPKIAIADMNVATFKEVPAPIIYVDDELYEGEMNDIDAETIASVNVFKGGDAIEKYGEKGKNGVIVVKTKTAIYNEEGQTEIRQSGTISGTNLDSKDKKDMPLFVIDGIEKKNSEFSQDEIKPDDIASISVLKGDKAIEKYGVKGFNGVIEITTKKVQSKAKLYVPSESSTPAYFPGCDDVQGVDLKDKCSKTNLLNYIYTKVKYPSEARKRGIEGMTVTSFIIDEYGRMKDIKLIRKVEGLSENALSVIGEMAKEIVWTPATKDGKAISMEFNLPIMYKLPKEKTESEEVLEKTEMEIRTGEDLKLEGVSIFPNPAKELVNIKFKAEAKPLTLDFFNIDGKQLYQKVYSNFNGSFDQSINLSQFSEKVILIRVRQDGKTFTRKLVVE